MSLLDLVNSQTVGFGIYDVHNCNDSDCTKLKAKQEIQLCLCRRHFSLGRITSALVELPVLGRLSLA